MTEPVWSQEISVNSVDELQRFAAGLGAELAPGDLLILTGELGAGKTTFTQGLGRGLGVREGIISPTFVLVRNHPSLTGGPGLVHVDAYRLESDAEIDDLDLESTLEDSVTVVEWGAGRVEHLADSRLHVTLVRPAAGSPVAQGDAGVVVPGGNETTDDDDEPRQVRIDAYGPRWAGMQPRALV
ncbi:tRNA (adenosine(37)-N6)-threonylcarbamoyltransferase complex ATPase subunit type 1 TsaE [Arthrobacter sp. JZ12]|uniref:tRNA (adenosine(37)-N6)-threonylcarbamoyltransferase complex ATPase subunit type 1 TsaE n=1 Tax=Arthrobacter sp. JZ12 TaxID=2654190 RepID=UPI002B4A7D23|nr:tRNA (adenosine(37)-N6)-threonylcarbamoyltransferase complex ATPase subunit type 1 TsaE [Arthrobacter sp. JZ12]WRH25546.1 tRNA (adenosine(37)-N6)-threonylcarbamoyltransferase complex ATPase subunit type 1 TsaE [Arthrobacter sp. JZ12]